MRDHRYLLLGFLFGVLTFTACARPRASVDTSGSSPISPGRSGEIGQISNGMSDAEVVQRLGPPAMVSEQPLTPVKVQTPNGVEFREKRHYTYYYPGSSQNMDMLITFEDGVVVDKRTMAR